MELWKDLGEKGLPELSTNQLHHRQSSLSVLIRHQLKKRSMKPWGCCYQLTEEQSLAESEIDVLGFNIEKQYVL